MQSWSARLRRLARLRGLRRGETLLFCHIPKCAGTSFRAVVELEYRPHQRLFLYKNELDLANPDARFLAQFKQFRKIVQIVYGHFSFGVHRLLDVPPCYATIVREPIARVVSLYHHIARDPSSPFFARVNAGTPLKEFVAGRFTEMTHNQMTRMLAGMPPTPGAVSYDDELLQQAKENIENSFCVVGTMEAMDDVVRKLGRRFAWRHHAIPTLNVMPQASGELDDETRDVLVEHNRLDLALYEWIKMRGDRTFGGSDAEEVGDLRSLPGIGDVGAAVPEEDVEGRVAP